MNCAEKQNSRRPLVADLNPALMCRLCGGYYVDAAAIIECLHAFCKSCLVRYLETNKYCPICDVQVHKSRPLQNIRLDPTLQDMVYKLVPGLYHKEMKSRREFYSERPDAPPSSLDDRGETPPELCPFYTPDEPVSLVLAYKSSEVEIDPTSNIMDSQNKRYLRCPAAVKITHLEKLLRNKYGLDNRYNIDLMMEDSKLSPDLTLMDVAYAFGRKRKGQFLFTYRIYDSECKKMRLSGDWQMDTLPPPEMKVEAENQLGSAATTCAVTPLPTPVMTAPSVTTPLTSAPVSTSVTTDTPAVSAAPSDILATSSVTTSVAPATTVAVASTAVTSAITMVTPVTLTITPITSVTATAATVTSSPSGPTTTSIPSSASRAPVSSLAISVQRLNPATVKSITSVPAKGVPEKSNPPVQTTATSTDKSNKLDSIISRLGDPSKHPRSESNSAAAPKKENTSFKKAEGKEVELRISENGEMITNVIHKNEKMSTPQAKPAVPSISSAPKSTTRTSHSVKTCETSASCESAPKQGAVAPVSPSVAPSPRKPGSSPMGYKTLKSGPKSWNPTISRNSYLSARLEQQQQQQQQQLQKAQQQNNDNSSPGSATKSAAPEPVVKPPRFFKARNTPRYLGNPASGVKPMYQIASPPPPPPSVQKPPAKPPSKPPAVLKLDPKTLTPIMTSAASGASSSPPQTTQTKDRPPFLSTTISGSNHLPSSRSVTTTSTTVTENSSKMRSSDLAMRNTPSSHPYMRLFSFCDPLNPFSPQLGDPNRSPPYASLLRAPFSPLLVNSYGLSRPPVGISYSQPLHRQVNHTGPLSPVPGLPSPLPPTPAPLSPSATPKNVIPSVHWGQASPSNTAQGKVPLSPQPVTCKKPPTEVQPKPVQPKPVQPKPVQPKPVLPKPVLPKPVSVAQRQTQVNGEKLPVKDKSANVDDVPVKPAAEVEKKEGEIKAASVKDNTKESKSSQQDNNNTLVIEKKSKSDEPVVEQSQSLSHNVSKFRSSTPSTKESPVSKVDNSSADQVVIKES